MSIAVSQRGQFKASRKKTRLSGQTVGDLESQSLDVCLRRLG